MYESSFIHFYFHIIPYRIDAGSGESVAKSKHSIELHKWHKIRLVRDSKKMRLYVDNQDFVTANNVGKFTKINLKEIMYVGTIYTEDKSSPDRYGE